MLNRVLTLTDDPFILLALNGFIDDIFSISISSVLFIVDFLGFLFKNDGGLAAASFFFTIVVLAGVISFCITERGLASSSSLLLLEILLRVHVGFGVGMFDRL